MRILLTGATGFVGRALSLRLQRDGHTVLAWVRDPAAAQQVLGADVVRVAATDDDAALERVVADVDAVVNLAGEPIVGQRWSDAYKRRLTDSRVQLTRRLAAALARVARDGRSRTLVSASAVGYYGERGDERLSEQSPAGSDFLAQLCQAWESATAAAREAGVRTAILRIGVVLGPEGGALAKLLPPFRLGLGGPIGSGRQWMPWIHLLDLVELITTALGDARYAGAIDAVAPAPVTNGELARTLGRVLGRPAVLPVPSVLLRLALGEAAVTLLGSQRVEGGRLAELGFVHRFPTLEAALYEVVGRDRGVRLGPIDTLPDHDYVRRRRPRYMLSQTTYIERPIDEVFRFFSAAENLGAITPPALAFIIRTPLPIALGEGAVIDYTIKLGPVPMPWRTIIRDWRPGACFIDSQERGPYASWWHEHTFHAEGARTRMEDRVYYAPPLGPLGAVAHVLFIRGMLRRIFGFRAFAIALRYGESAEATRQ